MIDSTAIIGLPSTANPWGPGALNQDQTNLPEQFSPWTTFWQRLQATPSDKGIQLVYSQHETSILDYTLPALSSSGNFKLIKAGHEPRWTDNGELSAFGASGFYGVFISDPAIAQVALAGAEIHSHSARGVSLIIARETQTTGPGPMYALAAHRLRDESVDDHIDLVRIKDELLQWLHITHDELSSISGISRGTFFNWARSNAVPRVETTRRLLRVYALVRALRNQLSPTDMAAWFQSGTPSPMDRLRQKDFEGAEQAASDLLFRDLAPDQFSYSALAPDVELDIRGAARSDAPKRSFRGRRRA